MLAYSPGPGGVYLSPADDDEEKEAAGAGFENEDGSLLVGLMGWGLGV